MTCNFPTDIIVMLLQRFHRVDTLPCNGCTLRFYVPTCCTENLLKSMYKYDKSMVTRLYTNIQERVNYTFAVVQRAHASG